jgi:hypothetical protein
MNQLIIVIGLPKSGKYEHILDNYANSHTIISADNYINAHIKETKVNTISQEMIESARLSCLKEFRELSESNKIDDTNDINDINEINEDEPAVDDNNDVTEQIIKVEKTEDEEIERVYNKVVLSLYTNTPPKWIEFLKICAENEYTVEFVIPKYCHFYKADKFYDSHNQENYLRNIFRGKFVPMTTVGYDDKGNTSMKPIQLFDRLVTEVRSATYFILNLKKINNELKYKKEAAQNGFGRNADAESMKEELSCDDILDEIKNQFSSIMNKEEKSRLREIEYNKNLIEKEEKKKLRAENKLLLDKKKSKKTNQMEASDPDEFYSDAKFANLDAKNDDEEDEDDGFILPKNRKQRKKEMKQTANNAKHVKHVEITRTEISA